MIHKKMGSSIVVDKVVIFIVRRLVLHKMQLSMIWTDKEIIQLYSLMHALKP